MGEGELLLAVVIRLSQTTHHPSRRSTFPTPHGDTYNTWGLTVFLSFSDTITLHILTLFHRRMEGVVIQSLEQFPT